MKIAVTAKESTLQADLDPHFGRARRFIVHDTGSAQFSVHDNARNLNAAQGAGIQAAQNVAQFGANILITGNVGPKAFRALAAAGIKVFLATSGTVANAITDCENGRLAETTEPNVEGHWV